MKIVIDIDEKDYKRIKEIPETFDSLTSRAYKVIKEGTPLPKGCGDLIDRKNLIENGISKGFCDWYDEIKMADTIIEADNEE